MFALIPSIIEILDYIYIALTFKCHKWVDHKWVMNKSIFG
jgi:hypothetical protein